MKLRLEQLKKVSLLSDTVLYPEAVSFMRKLVQDQHRKPIPTSQLMGLWNIALHSNYSQLYRFVMHQRNRNWSGTKRDIKVFYTDLEKFLVQVRQRRLKDEFQLGTSGLTDKEADELMILLAREFIQHLVAENGLLAARL